MSHVICANKFIKETDDDIDVSETGRYLSKYHYFVSLMCVTRFKKSYLYIHFKLKRLEREIFFRTESETNGLK